mgnify:CR=1 FL=1
MTITVYSKPACAFCDKAKNLLEANNLSYDELIFDVGQLHVDGKQYVDLAEFKQQYPDVKSVPQIFIDGVRIGGYTELTAHVASLK